MSSTDKKTLEGEGPWDSKTSQKFNKYVCGRPESEPIPRIHEYSTDTHRSFSKRPGEYFDPCQEAASRSLKCLARNGGDRELCTDFFQYVGSSAAMLFTH